MTNIRSKYKRPGPYQREVSLDVPPKLQLDFYDHCVVLTRRQRGTRWTSYPVNPLALAGVLGNLPSSSGLLARDTLAHGLRNGTPFWVMYIPPHKARVQIEQSGAVVTVTIPTPPLVWYGCGSYYHIWALNTMNYPTNEHAVLHNAPFPNVYESGTICWGTSDSRPVAGPTTILKVFDLFMTGSRFNGHLVGQKSRTERGNVLPVLTAIDSRDVYPLDDLMPSSVVFAHVLRGEVQRGL